VNPELPELPEDIVDELIALDPTEFLNRPTTDEGALSCESLEIVRSWLAYIMAQDGRGPVRLLPLNDPDIDQAVESLAADYRKQGLDLWSERDLLSAYWTHQACVISLLGDLAECGGTPGDVLHTYIHILRPMANLALTFELLLLAVLGEAAAFFPEEVN
jgi:hypothetical protein